MLATQWILATHFVLFAQCVSFAVHVQAVERAYLMAEEDEKYFALNIRTLKKGNRKKSVMTTVDALSRGVVIAASIAGI